jgi:hypothetical protein
MKFLAFAAAALLAASPALAQRNHRVVMAGGDPDLDLTVRPRADAARVEPGPDDNVYLPGLTERRGVETAADMSSFKGQGGPVEDNFYPPCSAAITDRCIQLETPRRRAPRS